MPITCKTLNLTLQLEHSYQELSDIGSRLE